MVQLKLTDPQLGAVGSNPIIDIGRFVMRLPAAIVFWSLAGWLTRLDLGEKLAALDPYMFFAFCAHTSILPVLWTIWQIAAPGYYHPLYPAFFFTAPALVFAISVVGAQIMNVATPNLFSILNGGRPLQSITSRRCDSPRHASGVK